LAAVQSAQPVQASAAGPAAWTAGRLGVRLSVLLVAVFALPASEVAVAVARQVASSEEVGKTAQVLPSVRNPSQRVLLVLADLNRDLKRLNQ